jgi:AAA family ATP:ADP antiporter
MLSFSIFLLFVAYYLIKPVREALILSGEGSAEIKSYAAAGQALLLMMAVPLYGWLSSQYSRRRLMNIVSVSFSTCLLIFYTLAVWKVQIGVVFYLFVGVLNLMMPAQYWSFSNDIYSRSEGERLFFFLRRR